MSRDDDDGVNLALVGGALGRLSARRDKSSHRKPRFPRSAHPPLHPHLADSALQSQMTTYALRRRRAIEDANLALNAPI